MANAVISAILQLRDRNFTSGLNNAAGELSDFDRGVQSVGNQLNTFGRTATNGFKTVVKGAAGLAAAGLGLTGFGASVAAIVTDMDKSFSRLEAKTGTTGKELEGLKGTVKDVFQGGFGESISQVSDDVATLNSMFEDLNADQIGNLAKGAYTIGDLWGAEVSEVGKTIKTMTKNFDGLSESDALDLMTTAFHKTGDYSNDLIDTFNEYSMHFSKLGLNAEDFTGILIKGAKAGAFNMDKVGDAVKELGIRVIDESKTTAGGFKDIGLNADEMTKKFGEGGESASGAFAATIAGLAAMKDPVARNAAGVALFETQWEDLRDDVILSMTDSSKAVEGFQGATQRATDSMQDNFGTKMMKTWRELKIGLADAFEDSGGPEILDTIATKIQELAPKVQVLVTEAVKFADTIRDNWGTIKETVIGISSAVATFVLVMGTLKIVSGVIALYQGFRAALALATAGQWAMNTALLASPLTWVAIAIAAVVAAGVLLYRNWDTVKAKADELWAKTKEVFGNIYDWGSQKIQGVTSFFGGLVDKVKDFISRITSFKPPEWVGKIGGAISSAASKVGGLIDGSHATGLNYVPKDGYVAELHKGEMVIPARQAESVRQTGSISNSTTNNRSVNLNVTVNAKGVTASQVVDELVPQLQLRLANL